MLDTYITNNYFGDSPEILKQLKIITMKFAELEARLDAANTKLDKVTVEVQELKELVTTEPDVPQSIIDKVASLEQKLQAVDDINEDSQPGEGGEETTPTV
jgi:F0F1-type ATP synthase delta subunit